MDNQKQIIINSVEQYVDSRLKGSLSRQMYFHNLEHTLLVVKGVQHIGSGENMSDDEIFILILAAWLHDVGYVERYTGHEEESAKIAKIFLEQAGLNPVDIHTVVHCILATKFPQQPANQLEKVICDADFYHFAQPGYMVFAQKLKAEWEINLHLDYSDLEWNKLNLAMLSGHSYFTSFGKKYLQPEKNLNIQQLLQEVNKQT